MATDVIVPGANEPGGGGNRPRERAERIERGGFFTIYKKGQGYWTRILSAAGAGLIIILTVSFLWKQIPFIEPLFRSAGQDSASTASLGRASTGMIFACSLLFIGLAWLCWYLMNRPGNVDFLIATDSEMKKVNWTSKKELIGSTKVVIIFMFLIAIVLFILDMYFTRLFYLAGGVLKVDSPLWDWVGMHFGNAGKHLLDVVMSVIVFGGAAWAVYGASKTR